MLINVKTLATKQVLDITDIVNEQLKKTVITSSSILIVVLHTTCGVTTADLDPGTDLDFVDFLAGIIPNVKWRHPHNPDHVPDHLLASLIGPSLVLPLRAGRLQLGTWQRVVLIELSGPSDRNLELVTIG